MKKIFIIISFIFTFFVSFSFVNADEYQPIHIGTINNCYAYAVSDSNSGFDVPAVTRSVEIYEVVNNVTSYSFKVDKNSGSINIFGSDTLELNCTTSMTDRVKYYRQVNGFNTSTIYSFNTSRQYFYVTATDISIEWQGSVVSPQPDPEPESTIPHITISDHDFYLFYDFDTISDFDIFSSYDFTNFTDFEKIIVTIVINILYLLFIFFTLYFLLKAINKLVSWVFR